VRLLLDEMLTPVIARELRARGHDAEAVAGHPDRQSLSDPEILAIARAEHRALVTNNVQDFRPLHTEAITPGGPGHCGMIFIAGSYRRTRAEIGKIITALQAIMAAHPGEADLANGEAWL
jgi:predicted nuclease of predicted toxin-antitoxin system